ncbi:MAG: class I SAM-dependent methyltransferase [Candidatus Scalinduaceae bacterium]
MISSQLLRKYYPDGSWSGTLKFYDWIRSLIRSDFIVLNIGAGPTSTDKIKSLKGEVKRVVGADIDPIVLNNKDMDEAVLIKNDTLPFPNNTFDMAWADYVLEHIEKPEIFLNEAYRVLKPGASFFFRAPNKYHYVSLVGRLTPHWVHKFVANKVVGNLSGATHKHFPTYYRLNSKKDVIKHSKSAGFQEIELRFVEPEPSYLMFHSIPFLSGVMYEGTVNRFESLSGIRANIFGKLTKNQNM